MKQPDHLSKQASVCSSRREVSIVVRHEASGEETKELGEHDAHLYAAHAFLQPRAFPWWNLQVKRQTWKLCYALQLYWWWFAKLNQRELSRFWIIQVLHFVGYMKIHHSSNGTGQSVPQVSQARYSEQQSLKWIDSGHILLHLHSKQIAGEPEPHTYQRCCQVLPIEALKVVTTN